MYLLTVPRFQQPLITLSNLFSATKILISTTLIRVCLHLDAFPIHVRFPVTSPVCVKPIAWVLSASRSGKIIFGLRYFDNIYFVINEQLVLSNRNLTLKYLLPIIKVLYFRAFSGYYFNWFQVVTVHFFSDRTL